VNNYKK